MNKKSRCAISNNNDACKSTTKQLVINSLFRENYDSSTPSEFTFVLPDYIRNVSEMTVSNVSIPNSIYNITNKNSSNSFTIYEYDINYNIIDDPIKIVIPNGLYNIEQLNKFINYDLSYNNLSSDIKAHYNEINKKYYFTFNKDSSRRFLFDFTPINCSNTCNDVDNIHGSLGWILGFRKKIYSTFFYNHEFIESLKINNSKYSSDTLKWLIKTSASNKEKFCMNNLNEMNSLVEKQTNILLPYGNNINSDGSDVEYKLDTSGNISCGENDIYRQFNGFIGESCYNMFFIKSLYLYINDYNNNHVSNIVSTMNNSLFNTNIIAIIDLDNEDFCKCENGVLPTVRKYCGLINVKKFEIKVYDDIGRIVDLNDVNILINLNITIEN